MSDAAVFDVHDHAAKEGWATHHKRPLRRFRLRCWLGSHVLPPRPATPNGYSPSCSSRCSRCRGFLTWFVVGQHRYGSYDRSTARAYGLVPDTERTD